MTIDKMIDVAKIVQHNLGKELTRDDIQKTFQCGIVDAIQIHAAISVRKEYKVAGVTFCNEDGTSRQQILRAYNLGEPPFGLATNPVINLVEYEYQGNPAFYVMANGLCVGNLEAVAVPEVKEKFENNNAGVAGSGLSLNHLNFSGLSLSRHSSERLIAGCVRYSFSVIFPLRSFPHRAVLPGRTWPRTVEDNIIARRDSVCIEIFAFAFSARRRIRIAQTCQRLIQQRCFCAAFFVIGRPVDPKLVLVISVVLAPILPNPVDVFCSPLAFVFSFIILVHGSTAPGRASSFHFAASWSGVASTQL